MGCVITGMGDDRGDLLLVPGGFGPGGGGVVVRGECGVSEAAGEVEPGSVEPEGEEVGGVFVCADAEAGGGA